MHVMSSERSERNNAIDFFRFAAATFVVALHTDLFMDVNPLLSYLFAQVLSRIAVPFFFAVSGYYYIIKLESGANCAAPYCKRLLATYSMWSAVYYCLHLIQGDRLPTKRLLLQFVMGMEYHLWFFPTLIAVVLLVTWVYHRGWQRWLIPCSIVIYLTACLDHAYYYIGNQIPGIRELFNTEFWAYVSNICIGLPCFMLGEIVRKTEKQWKRDKVVLGLGVASGAGYLCEVFLLKMMDWARTIAISISLYIAVYFLLIVLLKNPLAGKEYAARWVRKIAGFTYVSHVLVISIVRWINGTYLSSMLSETPIFLITMCATCMLGGLLGKSNNKLINAFMA